MNGNWRKYIGPGPLITAAFIGPGTVTVCTLAGIQFGYDLLWAILLSIAATAILQEMAARIGLVTQKGLTEVILSQLPQPIIRLGSLILILGAIVVGNAAYEAGNISGASLGMELFIDLPFLSIGRREINPLNVLIGLVAGMLLFLGNYKWLTLILTGVVVLMSLAFLTTAMMVLPDIGTLSKGFIPLPSSQNLLTILALIGTTVVPYNLFLHASLVSKKWNSLTDLPYIRTDIVVSVVLGGVVSMAIVITAAGTEATGVENAADLARGLALLLGNWGTGFMGFGLFAAGLTSAITAPMAGGLVVTGAFGLSTKMDGLPMRVSMGLILGLGLLFSSLGIRPVELITIAQLTNGMLLPLLSGYILWLVNKKELMKSAVNTPWTNFFAFLIWIITVILGGLSLWKVLAG
ncbi:MAG: divalent metal cation transporter [Lunatimonas sp.]|uniref:NRAMP family divalent metal transporter n=1 Tax=Lunatimonas sp. TaxID=2060141 RepID=UPI00263B4AD0|nr:divalent metal cation transporter [Lunatimonas sp.]MCC5938597.1 divalent metal cation transporter [Lunatimonas sp.]